MKIWGSIEKKIEAYLGREVKKLHGLSLKLVTIHFLGLPDRLILLPKATLFFAEIKDTGVKPDKIQLKVHDLIRRLGFTVYVIDTIKQVDDILNEYRQTT